MKEKLKLNNRPQRRKYTKYCYFFVIFFLFLFSFQTQSNARLTEIQLRKIEIADQKYEIPPLPKETGDQVVILISQERIGDEFIHQLQTIFPEIVIRHKFEHVFHGLSLKGPAEKLEEVEKYLSTHLIKRSFEVDKQPENTPNPTIDQTDPPIKRLIEPDEHLDNMQNPEKDQTDVPIKRSFEADNQFEKMQTNESNPIATSIKRSFEPENQLEKIKNNETELSVSSIKRSFETDKRHDNKHNTDTNQNNITSDTNHHSLNKFQLFPSYTYKLEVNTSNEKPLNTTNLIDYIGTDSIRRIKDKNGNSLTGKGIKVGIIDTGIDYTHFDLRKTFVKGFDFVDNDQDPMETENLGPLSTFHGTHVAGVIAANGKMTGIAPDAEVYVYRALGPGGFGTTEMIIAAIEQAIKDQVDILNLSLGVSINGPDLPTSLALDKAVEKGIIAVTSNGNSGPEIWTVGSPGTSRRAISVGASTPEMEIPYLEYDGHQFRINPINGYSKWKLTRSYNIIDGKLGKKEELEAIPIDGKMVLIQFGEITLMEKVMNAYQNGAKAILIYINEDKEIEEQLQIDVDIPMALLTKESGEQLLQLIHQKQTFAKIIRKKEEDLLAEFSSRGPVTYTWDIKPDVVAPGVAIQSTVPGGYLTLQGTSMSAPHVAGAAALLKQLHPDYSPEQIKAILMNTSVLLKDQNSRLYQPYEQGAGRIDLTKAIQSNSIVYPASLKLGKIIGTKLEEKTKHLTVENISDKPVHYTFTTPPRSDEINWDLPLPFTLEPNQKKKIKIGMEIKDNHKENSIYDGYLTMHANSQTIHLPYLYVVNEPDYPRIMAFSLEIYNESNEYKYEVYLPGGADEFGIALLDADTYQFADFLDWGKNVKRGLVTKKGKLKVNLDSGVYIAVAFSKKEGKEDFLEQLVEIGQPTFGRPS